MEVAGEGGSVDDYGGRGRGREGGSADDYGGRGRGREGGAPMSNSEVSCGVCL